VKKYKDVLFSLCFGLRTLWLEVWVPAGAGNFSLHHRVQSDSGAEPASYQMDTSGSFPGGRAVRYMKLTIHIHVVLILKMLGKRGALPPLSQHWLHGVMLSLKCTGITLCLISFTHCPVVTYHLRVAKLCNFLCFI